MEHPMNICKPLLTIIAASALIGLAPQAIADNSQGQDNGRGHSHGNDDCRAKILSSTITVENNEPAWIISGNCLESVTNVSLAKDDGDGFEDLPFSTVTNENSKTSLKVRVVARSAGIGGFIVGKHSLSVGQYLLQVKSCRIGKSGEKCKIYDETSIPALGDQATIDSLLTNGPSILEKLNLLPSVLEKLNLLPTVLANLAKLNALLGIK